jgi:hypothetical protein
MVSMVYLPRPLGLVAHQRLFNFSPVICTQASVSIAHELPAMRHHAAGPLPAPLPAVLGTR